MNRNGLAYLSTFALAFSLCGCGGAVERAGGDVAANNTASASPAPTADRVANAAPAAGETPPASASPTAAASVNQAASAKPSPSGAGGAPPAKVPTPQIGSGGNDLFLFTQARAAVNGDAELKSANIVIDVKGGVVTLSGAVATAALKSRAERLARDAGAKDVKNQLSVSAGR